MGKTAGWLRFFEVLGFWFWRDCFLLPAYASSFKLLMRDYCLGFGVLCGHNLVFWHSLPPAVVGCARGVEIHLPLGCPDKQNWRSPH